MAIEEEEPLVCPTPLLSEKQLVFVKQKSGAEDLYFGFGTLMQFRQGEGITITKINADTIPYDATRSVKDVLDELLAR